MKLFSTLVLGIILLSITGCGSGNTNDGQKYTGIIEPTGITSYQYGTHTLETDNEFYALKSETIDLSQFEGKKVTITAVKVEGYPVDGGPVYLEVKKVQN